MDIVTGILLIAFIVWAYFYFRPKQIIVDPLPHQHTVTLPDSFYDFDDYYKYLLMAERGGKVINGVLVDFTKKDVVDLWIKQNSS